MDRSKYEEIIRRTTAQIPKSMPKEEAFYTILAAAVVADHEVADVETQEREALVHRSRTLQKMREERPGELDAMRKRVNERLQDFSRLTYLVTDAASSLKDDPDMSFAVFAHATDIIFADSKFVEKEVEFLLTLAHGLAINEEDMSKIMDFISRKNKF